MNGKLPEREPALVSLIEVLDETHASAIVAGLENNGINARVDGGFLSGFKAETLTTVKIMVMKKDFDKAKKILDFLQEPIDWSEVDVGDPVE